MTESTLATFRIDKTKWDAFKNEARNASNVLNRFIDAYLAGEITLPDVPEVAPVTTIPSNLDSRLSDIEKRLEAMSVLEARLSRLEASTTTPDLDAVVGDRIEAIIQKQMQDALGESAA